MFLAGGRRPRVALLPVQPRGDREEAPAGRPGQSPEKRLERVVVKEQSLDVHRAPHLLLAHQLLAPAAEVRGLDRDARARGGGVHVHLSIARGGCDVLALRIPRDALDVVLVSLEADQPASRGLAPHDGRVIDGTGDERGAPGRPREILDVVGVPAEGVRRLPRGRIAVEVLGALRRASPQEDLAGIAARREDIAARGESDDVHRLGVRGESLQVLHVRVSVGILLQGPEFHLLIGATGDEAAGGGIEVDGEHGRGLGGARSTLHLRVPQHLDGLDLHRRDRRAPSVMGAPATFAHFSNFVWYRSQKVVACTVVVVAHGTHQTPQHSLSAPLLARDTVTRR